MDIYIEFLLFFSILTVIILSYVVLTREPNQGYSHLASVDCESIPTKLLHVTGITND